MFHKGSRYEGVPEGTWTDRSGRPVRYKRIRFIRSPDAQARHAVQQGDRLDLLAFRHYRDAERAWRIADANEAMWPDDLVAEVGRIIDIPPSEG